MTIGNGTSDIYVIKCHGNEGKVALNGSVNTISVFGLCILSLISLLAVILNGLIIFLFIWNKKLQTSPNVLLFNNALCDIFLGITNLIFWIPFNAQALLKYHSCLLYLIAVIFSNIASNSTILNTNLIALDRYIAIYKPYVYSAKVKGNLKVYVVLIILLWLWCCLSSIGGIFTTNFGMLYIFFIVQITISMTSPFLIYVKIYRTVRATNRVIHGHSTSQENYKEARTKELRFAKITSVLFATLVISYVPQASLMALWMHDSSSFTLLMFSVLSWAFACFTSKGVLTPIIYIYSITDIQKCFLKLFRKVRSDHEDATNASISVNRI